MVTCQAFHKQYFEEANCKLASNHQHQPSPTPPTVRRGLSRVSRFADRLVSPLRSRAPNLLTGCGHGEQSMFTDKKTTHENDSRSSASALRIGFGRRRRRQEDEEEGRCFSGSFDIYISIYIYLWLSLVWRCKFVLLSTARFTRSRSQFAFPPGSVADPCFFAGICIVLRTHTHTHKPCRSAFRRMGPRTMARPVRRKEGRKATPKAATDPAAWRGGQHHHTMHTQAHTLTQSSQAQSPPAHTDPIAPPVPPLWLAAPGGRWPQAKQTYRDLSSRRIWSGFFFLFNVAKVESAASPAIRRRKRRSEPAGAQLEHSCLSSPRAT